MYLCGPDRVGMESLGAGKPGLRVPAPLREAAPARGSPPGTLGSGPPARLSATLAALCAGGVTSAFLAPVPLLQTTTVHRAVSPQSLAGSAGTQVYLKLGSATSGATRAYYSITSVHLSNRSAQAGLRLSFDTSSLVLLGEVLRAAADGGRISHISLAFRAPGLGGRPTTESVQTFGAAAVTSFREHPSGTPTGTVSLTLPAARHVISTPGGLRRIGPFAGSSPAQATTVYVNTPATGMTAASSAAVTAVQFSRAAPRAPLHLGFTTSSLPLLDGIFRDQSAAASVPVLRLSIRAGRDERRFGTGLTYTFSALKVGSFAENSLSGVLSGTATLVIPPQR